MSEERPTPKLSAEQRAELARRDAELDANPEIALTYTSFAEISSTETIRGYKTDVTRYVAFGGRTPEFQMPTTGTATYSGVVYGRGSYGRVSADATLSGTSNLSTDFATGATSLALNLTATDRASGTPYALGTVTYANSVGPGGLTGYRNEFSLTAIGVGLYFSNARLQFNGPNAAEFAASFALNKSGNTGYYGDDWMFTGVAVGKKN